MASEAKTRKAKNGFLYDGGMKSDKKCKRTCVYQKRHRMQIKRATAREAEVTG